MEHDWIKATFIPAVVAKVRDATNLTRHFQGGHLLRKVVQHPSLSNLAIISNELTKYMLLIIQRKSFEYSPLLTEEMMM